MEFFKCKMCGGELAIKRGSCVAECEYCGTKQTIPKFANDKVTNLFERGNDLRRRNDFDKAKEIYEQILCEDSTDSETYWSLVLCTYGIEYVEEPGTNARIPTVHRAQYSSIFADDNYLSALKYADDEQKELYEAEAKKIDDIQKGILEISSKEEPFDVFICYKETDENGERTEDSVTATELYHHLTKEGFKVFFARITLEGKLGTAYEPYIFAALNSAKVMIAIGSKTEYFNATWVKNEWSRFLKLMKDDKSKHLIPAYKNINPYDLPKEFSYLQAQDMSKIGFLQDLIAGIKKLLNDESAPKSKPQAQISLPKFNKKTAIITSAIAVVVVAAIVIGIAVLPKKSGNNISGNDTYSVLESTVQGSDSTTIAEQPSINSVIYLFSEMRRAYYKWYGVGGEESVTYDFETLQHDEEGNPSYRVTDSEIKTKKDLDDLFLKYFDETSYRNFSANSFVEYFDKNDALYCRFFILGFEESYNDTDISCEKISDTEFLVTFYIETWCMGEFSGSTKHAIPYKLGDDGQWRFSSIIKLYDE